MHPAPDTLNRPALPIELTSFVGREREVAEVRQLLAATRLLTLTGAGGSGKTRLAMQAVRELDREVAWVELAALHDAAHIAQHIAQACGIAEEIRGGDVTLLARLLAGRELLIVLDNCEHLVQACAELTSSLLRTCPDLRVLATSREALGVSGERAWLVPALPGTEAIALFVERAREFAGTFELTGQNAAAVAEICRRLDGIPLAIELAAARIKLLSPEQIRDRLDDAFSLLKSSARGTVPRHRTLQAAMDWSYALLSAEERILFQRIATFRGGFTLDAVEAVGAGGLIEPDAVLDILGRLVDRSLVVVREQDGNARYVLLETVVQYARRKLVESGEEPAARRRHAEHFVALATEAEPHLITTDRPVWVERLADDLENLREALAWTRNAAPAVHIRLAGMLWWFWFSSRHWTEAARVLSDALALPEAATPTRERGKLLFAAGALAALQARPAIARPLLEEAITIAEALGDEQLLAYSRNYLGMSYAGETRAESRELCRAAAAWFAENQDPYGHRLALLLLATLEYGAGAHDESAELSRQAVDIARPFGQPRELAIALQTHALPYMARGEFEYARACLAESLEANRKDPSYFSITMALDCLAEIAGREGRPLAAARMLGAADHLRSVIGAQRFKLHDARIAAAVPAFKAAAGERAFDQALAEGRRLSADEILGELLAAEAIVIAPAAAQAPQVQAAPAHVQLRVRALGPLQVEVAGSKLPADLWTYVKPKELLVYLLCQPQGSSRDRIARALWPTATPAQLKNSFHVTLHHLRKVLGHAEWIVVEGDRYRLAPALRYEFDADVFANAARNALAIAAGNGASIERLRAALSLYRGDLLEDEISGDWLEEDQARLRRLQVDVALALGAALEATNHHSAAAEVYEQIIARDDLQEEAHRRLLACWTRMGDRPRALRHYEHLATVLRTVLDAEPEQETVDLYDRIRAADAV